MLELYNFIFWKSKALNYTLKLPITELQGTDCFIAGMFHLIQVLQLQILEANCYLLKTGFCYDHFLFIARFTALAGGNILSYKGGPKMCLIFLNINLVLFILFIGK
jgi:hypothetical protein